MGLRRVVRPEIVLPAGARGIGPLWQKGVG